jgi:hypothetical protein
MEIFFSHWAGVLRGSLVAANACAACMKLYEMCISALEGSNRRLPNINACYGNLAVRQLGVAQLMQTIVDTVLGLSACSILVERAVDTLWHKYSDRPASPSCESINTTLLLKLNLMVSQIRP